MTGTKEILTKRIDELKCLIQESIDKKANDTTSKKAKETMMDELKKLTVELKKEQKRIAIKKEIHITGKKIDALEFHVAKKKGGFAVDTAKIKKEEREKAKTQFFELMEVEFEYDKNDSKKYPGRLFFHKSIIEKYGICPYIDTNENCETNREMWLNSQEDGGQLYIDLYNRLYEHKDLQMLLISIKEAETDMLTSIYSMISASEKESFNEIYEFFEEYSGQSVKTKRLKDRHKNYINMLSVLQSSCNLPLHEFLSVKFDTHVFVNELQNDNNYIENTNINSAQILYIQNEFIKGLTIYKEKKKEYITSSKYTTNTLRNLKNELYKYLSNTIEKVDNIQVVKSEQNGKYFKKWTDLNEEEKNERFESFSKYYIETNIKHKKIDNENLTKVLADLLKDEYAKKNIVYRDLSWDVKRGFIKVIKILGYNEHSNKFYIVPTKKKCSVPKRSIFDENGERVANEAVLEFLIKKYKSGNDQEVKKDVDLVMCSEIIKTKLDIKKLSKVQIQQVAEIYNNMIDTVTDKSIQFN